MQRQIIDLLSMHATILSRLFYTLRRHILQRHRFCPKLISSQHVILYII